MQQKEKSKKRRKSKEKPKLEFDAGMVFDVEAATDVSSESLQDLLRFKARKGQGGDRRQSGPTKPTLRDKYPSIPWRVGQPIS